MQTRTAHINWMLPYNNLMDRCITNDITRFFRLHMWFRYLPLDGKEYLLFPWKGEQPKNAVEADIVDEQGIHWWIWDSAFIDEIPISGVGKDILMRYRISLNCFIRGEEDNLDGTVHVKGWQAIVNKYPRAMDILKRRHPTAGGDVNLYFRYEMESQIEQAGKAARNILEMFQQTCPEWLGVNNPENNERRLNRNFSLDSLSMEHRMHGTSGASDASISSPSAGKAYGTIKRSRSTSGGLLLKGLTMHRPDTEQPPLAEDKHRNDTPHHHTGHKFSHLLHNIKSFRNGKDEKSASSDAALEKKHTDASTSETVEIDDLEIHMDVGMGAKTSAPDDDNDQHPNKHKFKSLFKKKH